MAAKHIPEIAELERRCFSQPWTVAALTEELSNPQARFLAAVQGGVIGYIGVQEICGEAYITNVAVAEESRRMGVADALLKSAEDGAAKRGCAFITLEVRAGNHAAISLYKKRGYEQTGVRKRFYSLPDEDAFIMTKSLIGTSNV